MTYFELTSSRKSCVQRETRYGGPCSYSTYQTGWKYSYSEPLYPEYGGDIEHVPRMGEKRNVYRLLVWKPEG
jgi:hypothetical protein